MARRAALLLRDGEYVNLGLGLPTLVSNHVSAARDIRAPLENGMLGFGPLVEDGEEDVDLYNASGQLGACCRAHPSSTASTRTAWRAAGA